MRAASFLLVVALLFHSSTATIHVISQGIPGNVWRSSSYSLRGLHQQQGGHQQSASSTAHLVKEGRSSTRVLQDNHLTSAITEYAQLVTSNTAAANSGSQGKQLLEDAAPQQITDSNSAVDTAAEASSDSSTSALGIQEYAATTSNSVGPADSGATPGGATADAAAIDASAAAADGAYAADNAELAADTQDAGAAEALEEQLQQPAAAAAAAGEPTEGSELQPDADQTSAYDNEGGEDGYGPYDEADASGADDAAAAPADAASTADAEYDTQGDLGVAEPLAGTQAPASADFAAENAPATDSTHNNDGSAASSSSDDSSSSSSSTSGLDPSSGEPAGTGSGTSADESSSTSAEGNPAASDGNIDDATVEGSPSLTGTANNADYETANPGELQDPTETDTSTSAAATPTEATGDLGSTPTQESAAAVSGTVADTPGSSAESSNSGSISNADNASGYSAAAATPDAAAAAAASSTEAVPAVHTESATEQGDVDSNIPTDITASSNSSAAVGESPGNLTSAVQVGADAISDTTAVSSNPPLSISSGESSISTAAGADLADAAPDAAADSGSGSQQPSSSIDGQSIEGDSSTGGSDQLGSTAASQHGSGIDGTSTSDTAGLIPDEVSGGSSISGSYDTDQDAGPTAAASGDAPAAYDAGTYDANAAADGAAGGDVYQYEEGQYQDGQFDAADAGTPGEGDGLGVDADTAAAMTLVDQAQHVAGLASESVADPQQTEGIAEPQQDGWFQQQPAVEGNRDEAVLIQDVATSSDDAQQGQQQSLIQPASDAAATGVAASSGLASIVPGSTGSDVTNVTNVEVQPHGLEAVRKAVRNGSKLVVVMLIGAAAVFIAVTYQSFTRRHVPGPSYHQVNTGKGFTGTQPAHLSSSGSSDGSSTLSGGGWQQCGGTASSASHGTTGFGMQGLQVIRQGLGFGRAHGTHAQHSSTGGQQSWETPAWDNDSWDDVRRAERGAVDWSSRVPLHHRGTGTTPKARSGGGESKPSW